MRITTRTIVLGFAIGLLLMMSAAAITTLAGGYNGNGNSPVELLLNGGFEGGFVVKDGCGAVGKGWGCFNSGGKGGYGFYDDTWTPVVAEGAHAQLIEINTNKDFGDQNRTAGIYQTVKVKPGATYELNLKGMIRANDLGSGGDPWRYVMLVGFAQDGGADWTAAQWQEINVGSIQDRTNPSGYQQATLKVKAEGSKLTVFIAGRMKWGDWNREVDFDIDAASLKGPKPGGVRPPKPTPGPKPTSEPPGPPPVAQLVCDGPNLLKNGDFENGFNANGVGKKWQPYNNGGAAAYGYYDDQWPPVVAEGKHAQLLEINTYGLAAADADRLSGIYQYVKVKKGATYQLTVSAMIREEADHSNEDPNRYEVYWGYKTGSTPIVTKGDLGGWFGVPVSGISLRTSPGAYNTYSTTFEAPSKHMLLYLFGLMKWGMTQREADFDLDNVQLRRCRIGHAPPPGPKEIPVSASDPSAGSTTSTEVYTVQRGDTLSGIAAKYGVTVKALSAANGIKNPRYIRPGQKIEIPAKQ